MAILKIITDPNPILRKKAQAIKDPQNSEIQKLIPQMIEAMKKADGIGLAAPQIGKSIRLVIINTKDNPLPLINPVITSFSFRKETLEEGCLSVPGIWGQVKRAKKIKVKAQNQKGEELQFSAEGLFARVIQHEVDHLNGFLFIDKAIKITKKEHGKEL